MRTETPPTVRLEDYRPSDHLIDRVELDLRLDPHDTRVSATLALRPNPAGRAHAPSSSTATTSPCSGWNSMGRRSRPTHSGPTRRV